MHTYCIFSAIFDKNENTKWLVWCNFYQFVNYIVSRAKPQFANSLLFRNISDVYVCRVLCLLEPENFTPFLFNDRRFHVVHILGRCFSCFMTVNNLCYSMTLLFSWNFKSSVMMITPHAFNFLNVLLKMHQILLYSFML